MDTQLTANDKAQTPPVELDEHKRSSVVSRSNFASLEQKKSVIVSDLIKNPEGEFKYALVYDNPNSKVDKAHLLS